MPHGCSGACFMISIIFSVYLHPSAGFIPAMRPGLPVLYFKTKTEPWI
jgi:hypothetical protein